MGEKNLAWVKRVEILPCRHSLSALVHRVAVQLWSSSAVQLSSLKSLQLSALASQLSASPLQLSAFLTAVPLQAVLFPLYQ